MNRSLNKLSIGKRQFSAFSVFQKTSNPLEPVSISLQALQKQEKDSDLLESIEKAYSKGGLGALLISGIPNLKEMNELMCRWSYRMNVEFSEEEKKDMERPDVNHILGYSKGASLGDGNINISVADYFTCATTDRFELFDDYVLHESSWPSKHPQLKTDVTQGTMVLHDIQVLLARHLDYYLDEKLPGKHENITKLLSPQNLNLSRLGYCFPLDSKEDNLWLYWHQDYDIMTSLCPNICFNEDGEIVNWAPEDAGLFTMNSKTYEVQKFTIPPDCICIQPGEHLQILSGGEIVSTPHGVIAQKNEPHLSRASFVYFTHPPGSTKMDLPEGRKPEDIFYRDDYPLYQKVHMRDKWSPGISALEFFTNNTKLFFM